VTITERTDLHRPRHGVGMCTVHSIRFVTSLPDIARYLEIRGM